MANTYTQILIQYVFAVKYRDACIDENFREPLEKYITGIVSNSGHKLLAIYCMPDHCHILIGLHPTQSISDLARDIKSNSSKWINEEKHLRAKFNWQDGYGAFSYSRSQLDSVVKYILNQPEHHRKRTFGEEYIDFLQKFEVDHDANYLFDWID
ncbi:MAG: IS200/IS605 family transposase [Flavobacteriales bacterium]|nr:IS200/IS605 family transposase [Flavobacteriales bacterium]